MLRDTKAGFVGGGACLAHDSDKPQSMGRSNGNTTLRTTQRTKDEDATNQSSEYEYWFISVCFLYQARCSLVFVRSFLFFRSVLL